MSEALLPSLCAPARVVGISVSGGAWDGVGLEIETIIRGLAPLSELPCRSCGYGGRVGSPGQVICLWVNAGEMPLTFARNGVD